MKVILHLNNVNKTYIINNKPHIALHAVTLTIYEGEIISLLGVNGAGKTTLSSIIATIHPPTAGDVHYYGHSIYDNILAFRQQLGFCPQRPNFDRELSIKENLIFAGRYFLLSEKEVNERTQQLMERFELTPYADASISVLSGGYKQRLLLARALMHNPSIIILDEPTVALDPHIRRQLWNIILDLKKMGKTIILTTHYIDEAEYLSDRVCILDKGSVMLVDKPEELMSTYHKEKLEDVFLQLMEERSSADTE